MKIKRLTLNSTGFPDTLREIPTPPQQLFVAGTPLKELMNRPRVAIVGSRKVSNYGREVTSRLARELAARGVVIVSGLALGVDALAHRAALEAGGTTVAVLPSPIQNIYPSSHMQLARQILERSGTLVSEYSEGANTLKINFIARNRIVAGLSDAVLITEAAEKSGTLHTARFALEQGRDVLAVPGNITSLTSVGTNNLIKTGAAPITSHTDVLHALGLKEDTSSTARRGSTAEEQAILDLLIRGLRDSDVLHAASGLDVTLFNQTLTMLEITGQIRPLGASQWTLS